MIELTERSGRATATVAERAASLRGLVVDGTELVEPTAHREAPPGMSGALLAPWPNRVEDATWRHEGRLLRLPVNEPELGHAIHGLLTETDFAVAETHPDRVVLVAAIAPSPGYPFALAVRVDYALAADGVDSTIELENTGAVAAPVAVGAHPYPRIGGWPADELVVALDADYEWPLDARHLPAGRRGILGTPRDVRRPHAVGAAAQHAVYERGAESGGRLVHTVAAADGRVVEVHACPELRWTQWYVEPALDTSAGPRRAVAIEPMSAPPNALRTGVGLRRLEPGERAEWSWGIRLRQPASRER
jgi:aldose 1-epimerase